MQQLDIGELNKKIARSNENEYLGKNKAVNKIEPIVSVRVQTYQHARYIRSCLDSILMQKTDFPYEIIIGEDDSDDGTREICIEYAEKNQDKLRLFLRSRADVIYRDDGNPTGKFNSMASIAVCRSNYLALCEGDDYWTDVYKLQKQMNYILENPDCSLCIHAVEQIYESGEKTGNIIRPFKYNKVLTVEDIIEMGASFGASSMIYKKSARIDKPERSSFSGGHFSRPLICSTEGHIYYINEIMSVRRVNSVGSYSERIWNNPKKRFQSYQKIIQKLDAYNKYTGYTYASTIEEKQNDYLLKCIYLIDKKDLTPAMRKLISELDFKERLKIYLKLYAPLIYSKLVRLKRLINYKQNYIK